MANLQEYHSPATLADAVRLLTRPDRNYAVIGGGTRLVADLEMGRVADLDGVISLNQLELDTISVDADQLTIGAATTLTDLIEHHIAGTLAGGLLRKAARGEGPINLRNAATVGGVVAAAEADSECYAALLALGATVTIHDGTGESSTSLGDINGLVTAVTLPLADVRGGLARVARTPSDRPIVAAVAVVGDSGECIALCGVADRPILHGSPLQPPDDFKGSSAYRRALAPIVVERALKEARG